MIFFPNALYLLTDLLHILDFNSAPLWFDTLMLLIFTLNGILISIFSLNHIEELLKNFIKSKIQWFIIIIIFLNSVGIYAGRFLRFNSWDIASNPIQIISTIYERYVKPGAHPVALPFTIILSIFLLLIYRIYKDLKLPKTAIL